MWEGVGEGGDGLNWRESEFANVVRLWETKDTSHLVQSNVFLNFKYIWVQVLDVLAIAENESLFGVKPKSDDIFDVALAHFDCVFQLELVLVQEFFIVCDLDDERKIENTL